MYPGRIAVTQLSAKQTAFHVYHLGVAAKIFEFLTQFIQLAHQLHEVLGIDGGLQVKVEHKFKIAVWNRPGFQLDHVDSQYIHSCQNAVQCTGLVRQNHHNAGFTDEERQGMTNYLAAGFVDSFRFKNPEKIKYSWWSYRGQARTNNVGWRIDYFLLSNSLKDKLVEAEICDEVMGSDHCPVMIEMKDLSLNANMVEMEVVSPTVVLAEEVIEKTPETLQAKLDLGV